MPEGPEIRRQADKISDVLHGQCCENIEFGLSKLKRHEKSLKGSQIIKVTSKGKAMLIHFDNAFSIYSHNQLYGRWQVVKQSHRPKTNRQLRLAIDTNKGSALLYSASDIEVIPTSELAGHSFLSRLGPDVLDEETTIDVILSRFELNQFSRRQLASLLLAQSFLAGLGNYLRSEILFFAKLSPSRKLQSLSNTESQVLADNIKTITLRSYQTGGITVPERVYTILKAKGADFQQARFAVFNREGEGCLHCGGVVKRDNFGGRRIYYCEICQV